MENLFLSHVDSKVFLNNTLKKWKLTMGHNWNTIFLF